MRGELLWDKGSSASSSTRFNPQKRKSTISKEEFLEYTKSVWKFSAERASKCVKAEEAIKIVESAIDRGQVLRN